MHDVRLMIRDVHNHKGALRCTTGVSSSCSYLKRIAHYNRVNKLVKIHERDSVIVMAEKLF